jgi:hypothetical protein
VSGDAALRINTIVGEAMRSRIGTAAILPA